nr:DUF1275 family protein [Bradyrhizobium sp. WSM1253]
MSGGFLDAFTWLSLGVFASSQTGNVVFLGIYALSGQWQRALHHLLPPRGLCPGSVGGGSHPGGVMLPHRRDRLSRRDDAVASSRFG